MTELQHAVTQTLMDSRLFPHLAEDISLSVIYLYGAILQLRKNHAVLVSWDHYLQLASDAGVAEVDVERATAVLEFKVWEKSLAPISFPEPTCLLVSTKTRSSGIINKLVPRALVSFAFKI